MKLGEENTLVVDGAVNMPREVIPLDKSKQKFKEEEKIKSMNKVYVISEVKPKEEGKKEEQ
jgi:hypothetical protein